MQKIHGIVRDLRQRLVEGAAEQAGKGAETWIVLVPQTGEHAVVVIAGMLVAAPGIDRKAARIERLAFHRLAERHIGDARMGPSSTRTRGAMAPTIQCANGRWPHQALSGSSSAGVQNNGSSTRSERVRNSPGEMSVGPSMTSALRRLDMGAGGLQPVEIGAEGGDVGLVGFVVGALRVGELLLAFGARQIGEQCASSARIVQRSPVDFGKAPATKKLSDTLPPECSDTTPPRSSTIIGAWSGIAARSPSEPGITTMSDGAAEQALLGAHDLDVDGHAQSFFLEPPSLEDSCLATASSMEPTM